MAALALFPGSSMAWHSEVDPAAARVLAHHWPDVPNFGDITAVDWAAVPPVDVLTGGFPCQDVSAAGRRAGLGEGTRSGLWSHMAEAIAVLRPRYVLIENVRGLLSAKAAVRGVEPGPDDLGDLRGRPVLRALGAVLGDLADLGFDADWTCLAASAVGAAHRRERVFVLAYPADAEGDGRARADDGAGRAAARRGGEWVAGRGSRVGAVADAERQGPQGAISRGGPDRVAALLPTPRATDGTKGGPNQRGSSGDLMLPSAVSRLLPTPRASDGAGGPNSLHRAERMDDVETRVIRVGARWGEYESAIRRQESMTRPAPSPTELSGKGNPRLSARFAEWLMMWPDGWVTDPAIGLPRNDQLRIIGNGVVTPQAISAFECLLTVAGSAGAA
ncbi:DNA cytosine methyltransferase [Nocardia farcinica]